jgi:restriction system protein
MGRRNESLFEILLDLPWWVSVVFASVVYCALAWFLPNYWAEHRFLSPIADLLPRYAAYLAVLFLIPGLFSAINQIRKRKMLDTQKGIVSIRQLSWKKFEELVAEAYRRKSYRVIENSTAGPDGGIDIQLEKDGKRFLVQCKHWKSRKVGVTVIRELFGVVVAENAAGGIVVITGDFTADAQKFATTNGIELVDGAQLEKLICGLQAPTPTSSYQTPTQEIDCPKCGGQLVRRKAKRGANIGSEFLGCSSFPGCRFTQSMRV